ncbi:MAG: anthranilate synthase component I family protein [Bacteroidota bacterium]
MSQPIIYLNSNDGTGILAFGDGATFTKSGKKTIAEVQDFIDEHQGKYIFGYLSYDLKNDFYQLKSSNFDGLKIADTHLWVPATVVKLDHEKFEFVQGGKTPEAFDFIGRLMEEEADKNYHSFNYQFEARTPKEDYLATVRKIKEHIQRGDIYEVNYCQEFFTKNVELNFELDTYFKLNEITKAPFSSFLQLGDITAFCGSPERFLQRTGNKLISQPIKGTARRGVSAEEDDYLKEQLLKNPKELAENVMIVDLVRNDLSKIATKDSVKVDELQGLHTFETVHQLISTVSCEIDEKTNFASIIEATFPMGSMTGVPKLRAMELMEDYENFKRGLYAGSIGYIQPNGDFDFNVVIRSLIYNRKEKYMSCAVGGAITIQSDPEAEYEECLTKVGKIIKGMNEFL